MKVGGNAFRECVLVHVAKLSIPISFRITARYLCCTN